MPIWAPPSAPSQAGRCAARVLGSTPTGTQGFIYQTAPPAGRAGVHLCATPRCLLATGAARPPLLPLFLPFQPPPPFPSSPKAPDSSAGLGSGRFVDLV